MTLMLDMPLRRSGRLERILVKLVLALGVFAGAASMRILDALLPAVATAFAMRVGSLGAVVSAYALSYSLCQVAWGRIGDRRGPLRMIAWAALGSALAAGACALAPSFGLLVAARLLAGGVASAIGPLALTWIAHATPAGERAVTIARMSSASIIGTTAGQLGGGVVGGLLGWRAAFLVIAVLFLAAAAALTVAIRRSPTLARIGRSDGRRTTGLVELARQPAVRRVLCAVAVEGVAMYMAFTYVGALLQSRLGVDTVSSGVLISCFGLGGLAFVLIAPPLLRRWRESARAIVGASLASVGFVTLLRVDTAAFAAGSLLLLGLGFFLLHNIFQVRAAQMAPGETGAGVSLFAATFFLAQAVGSAVGGTLLDRVGFTAPFLLAPAILLCLGVSLACWPSEADDLAQSARSG